MALPLLELALKKRHKNLEMEHVDVEGETRISRIKDMWWLSGKQIRSRHILILMKSRNTVPVLLYLIYVKNLRIKFGRITNIFSAFC